MLNKSARHFKTGCHGLPFTATLAEGLNMKRYGAFFGLMAIVVLAISPLVRADEKDQEKDKEKEKSSEVVVIKAGDADALKDVMGKDKKVTVEGVVSNSMWS